MALGTMMCPDSPDSTRAVRGIDNAIDSYIHRHRPQLPKFPLNEPRARFPLNEPRGGYSHRAHPSDRSYASRRDSRRERHAAPSIPENIYSPPPEASLARFDSPPREEYNSSSFMEAPHNNKPTISPQSPPKTTLSCMCHHGKAPERCSSPSCVAQAFRTGQRVTRKISAAEPAVISRPEPRRRSPPPKPRQPQPQSTTTQSPQEDPLDLDSSQIEIEPGVMAPLRSTQDTLEAVAKGQFLQANCLGCQWNLFCLASAEFMICPQCRIISPLLLVATPEEDCHGVALGFTRETLADMRRGQSSLSPPLSS